MLSLLLSLSLLLAPSPVNLRVYPQVAMVGHQIRVTTSAEKHETNRKFEVEWCFGEGLCESKLIFDNGEQGARTTQFLFEIKEPYDYTVRAILTRSVEGREQKHVSIATVRVAGGLE